MKPKIEFGVNDMQGIDNAGDTPSMLADFNDTRWDLFREMHCPDPEELLLFREHLRDLRKMI